ncbi:hypothetical protein [Novosphingobium sp.]|uniref:hypothetical protein n=1 Tax=Novosphingobium sp. TaxID=1874826 RepID=UPI00333E64ED
MGTGSLHEVHTTDRMAERRRVVALALDLLDRAVTLLDHENLDIAAAKIDEARSALRVPAHFLAQHNAGNPTSAH